MLTRMIIDCDNDALLDERGEGLNTKRVPTERLRRREQKPVMRGRERYRCAGRMGNVKGAKR